VSLIGLLMNKLSITNDVLLTHIDSVQKFSFSFSWHLHEDPTLVQVDSSSQRRKDHDHISNREGDRTKRLFEEELQAFFVRYEVGGRQKGEGIEGGIVVWNDSASGMHLDRLLPHQKHDHWCHQGI